MIAGALVGCIPSENPPVGFSPPSNYNTFAPSDPVASSTPTPDSALTELTDLLETYVDEDGYVDTDSYIEDHGYADLEEYLAAQTPGVTLDQIAVTGELPDEVYRRFAVIRGDVKLWHPSNPTSWMLWVWATVPDGGRYPSRQEAFAAAQDLLAKAGYVHCEASPTTWWSGQYTLVLTETAPFGTDVDSIVQYELFDEKASNQGWDASWREGFAQSCAYTG
jgi:hypothetical protein